MIRVPRHVFRGKAYRRLLSNAKLASPQSKRVMVVGSTDEKNVRLYTSHAYRALVFDLVPRLARLSAGIDTGWRRQRPFSLLRLLRLTIVLSLLLFISTPQLHNLRYRVRVDTLPAKPSLCRSDPHVQPYKP